MSEKEYVICILTSKIMRTKLNKEQFIADVEKRYAHRTDLVEFYNRVFLPTLQKFHGKVYNIRFIKALREACTDELMFVREREYDYVIIEKRISKFNYSDAECLYLKLVVDRDGRIDANASIADELGQKWLANFNKHSEELLLSRDNYDEYIAKCEELRRMISEYAKLPITFRSNIHFYQNFILKGDL